MKPCFRDPSRTNFSRDINQSLGNTFTKKRQFSTISPPFQVHETATSHRPGSQPPASNDTCAAPTTTYTLPLPQRLPARTTTTAVAQGTTSAGDDALVDAPPKVAAGSDDIEEMPVEAERVEEVEQPAAVTSSIVVEAVDALPERAEIMEVAVSAEDVSLIYSYSFWFSIAGFGRRRSGRVKAWSKNPGSARGFFWLQRLRVSDLLV